MRLELVKLVVRPVVLQRDDEDRIVGEQVGEPAVIYTPEQFAELVQALQAEIVRANEGGQEGGSNGKMADAPQQVEPTEGGAGERDSERAGRRARA